ncbi:response regulator [Vibrio harveyi]|nr:response regulator [Vibrio harveyi]
MSLNMRDKLSLVADDSRLVTSSITTLLKKMGINDIHYAYKPHEVIKECKQNQFDLIICDYNFQSQINGFQIYEELQHERCIKASTVFIFLTGENDLKIVRSIISAEPDDYLLKPYNNDFFIRRLISSFKRKDALLPILKARLQRDFETVIDTCDKLLPFHPEHSKLIRSYKAHALVQSKRYHDARSEYEELLKEDELDWLKTALANTLIECDNLSEAENVLNSISDKEENPYYHDEMSNIAVVNNDLPKAISHLKQSTLLLDAGAERDLVITNLSLATESYNDAVTFVKRYYERNENTFRGGINTKLNLIRCHLYRAFESKFSLNNLFLSLNPIIQEINRNSKYSTQSKLISAHIHLINSEIKQAIALLKRVLKNNNLVHFYDLFHLCVVLEKCSLLREVKDLIPVMHKSIRQSQNPSIFRSQVHMAKSFEYRLQESQKKINEIRYKISNKTSISKSRLGDHLDYYFQLQELLPYSKKISLAIIKFAALHQLEYKGRFRAHEKLVICNHVIENLSKRDELLEIDYDNLFKRATKNVNQKL